MSARESRSTRGAMVLIHCKYKGEEQQFLYETTVEIGVKDLIKELVEVHNLRLRIQRLKSEGDDLATHGPCKPPDKQGLDEDIQAEADGVELPPRRDLTRRRVLGAGVRDRGGFQLGLLF